ncbi:hypothetical protein DY467_07725 [Rhodopseudomonas sp. BR0G17]|nr:hypothetical protein [Rhodopseudomonas sp. BR0G17]
MPDGSRPLRTLRDAAAYIEALPPAEQQHSDGQTALHVLLQAADHDGPMMFARIGVSRMVRRHHPEPPRPLRKDRPWGRRRLKRDE